MNKKDPSESNREQLGVTILSPKVALINETATFEFKFVRRLIVILDNVFTKIAKLDLAIFRLWRTDKVKVSVYQTAGGMWGANHDLKEFPITDNTLLHKVEIAPSAQVTDLNDGDVGCKPFRVSLATKAIEINTFFYRWS